MFVGDFEPDSFDGFQADVVSVISAFKAAKVDRLLIDLTNNGGGFCCASPSYPSFTPELPGGYVCLGHFLHHYLSGSGLGYPSVSSSPQPRYMALNTK